MDAGRCAMNQTQRDDGLSAHRTRTNRWPEPLHAPAALIVAVDDIFTDTPIEDRT